ncbi:Gfo/Idh/MocA family oxidoreductase [Conexibacter stalactiti]|uniref:Gfo/Idh/MocA family oxidoreductase n=1 Tax=Conexibacter stalactiti TaxID=1940611 RepID=A0ABU4HM72_9ACTN|nr:Gfo/Idh/MocA family oxidoreductase [Conexibacter stalactiti]MDW5594369.1 Gfo/Idh/MocA family oxidoreductase [Conexibacter stalactiti]MEC5035011.1 Gfo/Idh/MocA family oxidoreductase [Conexibacter stalactiti]
MSGGGAPLRAGIVGAGFIGAVHARSALLAGGRVTAVAASSEASARAAASRLGAARACASAEELVVADDVDVVHVCAPNHLHVPLAQAALEAGKHVVCEKPLALDDAGASTLVEQAASRALWGTVPFVYRYYPMVREARERLRDGRSGPLRLLHGTYLQDWLSLPADDNWRVQRALGGRSRAFADIGSHWCDLAEFASGHRIARLSARTATVVPQRSEGGGRPAFARGASGDGEGGGAQRPVDTEDVALVQFETDRGALGSVVVSQVSPGRKNRLWIEWDAGEETLVFDQEQPEQLWRGQRDAIALLQRDAAVLSPAAARLATLPAGHPQGYASCFDAFVADAYAAIRSGEAPDGLPLFADGRRAVQITEAVLSSAAAGGAWTDVPSPRSAEAHA